MMTPDLRISEEAIAHVREAIATWTGDNRDLARALQAAGYAMLLILEGRTDQIERYETAATAVTEHAKGPTYHG